MLSDSTNMQDEDLSVLRHKSGPYPGLRSFDENDTDLFFGRDIQIKQVIQRLTKSHVVAIIGGSGCGKSSLIRAGVIPEIRAYGIPNRTDTWITVTCTPGENPIGNLAEGLNKSLKPEASNDNRKQHIEGILKNPEGIANFFNKYQECFFFKDSEGVSLEKQANLLIVIDQFEELFRPGNPGASESTDIIRLITDSKEKPHDQVYLILTMRSEFLDRCANYPYFADILNEISYLTRRLEKKELIKIIEEPAKRYTAELIIKSEISPPETEKCWPFAESTRKQIINDVELLLNDTDHLSLLQHFLFRLWEAANKRWDEIKTNDFLIIDEDYKQAIGGINPTSLVLRDSLNNHVEAIYNTFDDSGKKIAEQMFRQLATIDHLGKFTRCWVKINQVFKSSNQIQHGLKEEDIEEKILKPFMEPHQYLRKDGKGNIDVAHESLIRNWKQFCDWQKQEKDTKDIYFDLVQETQKKLHSNKENLKSNWFSKLKPLFSSADILSPKEVKKIGDYKIDQLGTNWAKRYFIELKEKIILIKDTDSDTIYNDAIDYFNLSKHYINFKKGSIVALSSALFIFIFVYIIIERENIFTKLEMNAYEPYIIINDLKGSSTVQAEQQRQARSHQLYVAAKMLNELEKQMIDKNFYYLFADERWQRLQTIWRLSTRAFDDTFRTELPALVASKTDPLSNAEYKKSSSESSLDDNDDCQRAIQNDYEKTYGVSRNKEIKIDIAKNYLNKKWLPILIKYDSYFLLGVKHDNTCSIVNKMPVPPGIDTVIHDDSFQLFFWSNKTNDKRDIINVSRFHVYANTNNQFQFDTTSLGQIGDDIDNSISGLNTLKITPDGKAFSIERKNGTTYYKIRWHDTLESENPRENIGSDDTTIPEYVNNHIDKLKKSIPEQITLTTSAFQKIDDKTGYLAYITASAQANDVQQLTLLKLDNSLLENDKDSVNIEISNFAFRRPRINKIAFGKGTESDKLFFLTLDGDTYSTIIGLESKTSELEDLLKHSDTSLKDVSKFTNAYKSLKNNQESLFNLVMKEINEK